MEPETKSIVKISADVIREYAGEEAKSCIGIVGIGAMSWKDGFARVLKKDEFARGIEVEMKDEGIVLGFHIIVAYGVNIPAVAENLKENVIYKVQEFTGLKVTEMNIFVEGIRVID